MSHSSQTPLKVPSRVPETVLQRISLSQPIDSVVQDILQKGVLTPLTLSIPMSACIPNNHYHDHHGSREINGVRYLFHNTEGIARISMATRQEVAKLGSIELLGPTNMVQTSFILKRDTHVQIQAIMKRAQDLQKTGKIRTIFTNSVNEFGRENTLRYSDKDGNLYFLYAPKIFHNGTFTDKIDLHKHIRGIYREEDGVLRYYRVINSLQETGGKDRYIHLHIIEISIFDTHVFAGLYMNDLDTESHIAKMSRDTQVITISVERFYEMVANIKDNTQIIKK